MRANLTKHSAKAMSETIVGQRDSATDDGNTGTEEVMISRKDEVTNVRFLRFWGMSASLTTAGSIS